jgi:hypothetical protein
LAILLSSIKRMETKLIGGVALSGDGVPSPHVRFGCRRA